MFRKDPVAIAEWQADSPLQCAQRQKEILAEAVAMLKPGGQLIYSTCTFAPEENEAIIEWLVSAYPFSIEPIELENVSHGRHDWAPMNGIEKTIRLWPHKNQGEGHFAAKLTYLGSENIAKPKKTKKAKKASGIDSVTRSLWQSFQENYPFLKETTADIQLFGDHLWLVPSELPSLKGVRVLRPGLHVGTVKKNRIEPSFALAMAIKENDEAPFLSIELAQWQKYVAGETITVPGNEGWVVLKVAEVPIGFGKQVQGVVKNFFPKGLRFTLE